jgi:hypothetical protein
MGEESPSMTEQAENESTTVTLDGIIYRVVPTAFRSHLQVVGPDGKLLGLLELVEATGGLKFMARPASGTGMTQALLLRIAEGANALGVFG